MSNRVQGPICYSPPQSQRLHLLRHGARILGDGNLRFRFYGLCRPLQVGLCLELEKGERLGIDIGNAEFSSIDVGELFDDFGLSEGCCGAAVRKRS